jgi:hypothetical protein
VFGYSSAASAVGEYRVSDQDLEAYVQEGYLDGASRVHSTVDVVILTGWCLPIRPPCLGMPRGRLDRSNLGGGVARCARSSISDGEPDVLECMHACIRI